MNPGRLIAPVLVTLAVLVRTGLSENTGETALALLFMVVAEPFLAFQAPDVTLFELTVGAVAARRAAADPGFGSRPMCPGAAAITE